MRHHGFFFYHPTACHKATVFSRTNLHFAFSSSVMDPVRREWVDLSSSPADTAKQWVAVAHSKVTSANFLGSQRSVTTSLASQKMCSPSILVSYKYEKSFCLLYFQSYSSLHICFNLKIHTKALESKRPMI